MITCSYILLAQVVNILKMMRALTGQVIKTSSESEQRSETHGLPAQDHTKRNISAGANNWTECNTVAVTEREAHSLSDCRP